MSDKDLITETRESSPTLAVKEKKDSNSKLTADPSAKHLVLAFLWHLKENIKVLLLFTSLIWYIFIASNWEIKDLKSFFLYILFILIIVFIYSISEIKKEAKNWNKEISIMNLIILFIIFIPYTTLIVILLNFIANNKFLLYSFPL